tara:strand:+ start:7545 stop:7850 length:306 start_codon:yes stop_codon:yes gene_type:complete
LPNTKLIISIIVFSLSLFCISIIKNKTRIIEKKILTYEKEISDLKRNLYESQLDYYYLTSPEMLQEKITFLTNDEYKHMSLSKIYLNYNDFISEQRKLSRR